MLRIAIPAVVLLTGLKAKSGERFVVGRPACHYSQRLNCSAAMLLLLLLLLLLVQLTSNLAECSVLPSGRQEKITQ